MTEDFLQPLSLTLLVPDRIPVAMMAWLLAGIVGMLTGPLGGNANPLFWLVWTGTFGRIGARLDRRERARADLLLRGFVLTLAGALAACGTGVFAVRLAQTQPVYGLADILLLVPVLTGGTVWFVLLQLYFALRDGKGGKGAYYALARTARTDFSGGDDFAVTRAGLSLAARSFDKGLVAPVVWYLLAGLPGAYLYAGLAALAWRFGRDGFGRGFGGAALGLEKLMGAVPNLLAGVLIALAGLFTPTGGMTRALLGQFRGEARAPYAQGGFPVTALAFALHVGLGGAAVDLDGSTLKRSWVGPAGASARLDKGHLRRGLYLNAMAQLLFMAGLAGALLYAGRFF